MGDQTENWFRCYLCGGKKVPDIIAHHYSHHFFVKDCDFCKETFSCRGTLQQHTSQQHRGELGFYEPSSSVCNEGLRNVDIYTELLELKQNQAWKIVMKDNYGIIYDDTLHSPIICMEQLTKTDIEQTCTDEAVEYYPDGILQYNVSPKSFAKLQPCMHAGHLAAKANHTVSKAAFAETFCVVNIVPMARQVNCGIWCSIEIHTRRLVKIWDTVTVLSGPVYDLSTSEGQSVAGGLLIHVPAAFFKILILRRRGEDPKMQAFMIKNKYECTDLFHRRTTIGEIASRTGLKLEKYAITCTWEMKTEYFICNRFLCYLTFLCQKQYKNHQKVHKFSCRICGVSYDKESDLKTHILNHPLYTCDVCAKSYDKKAELNRHKRNAHSGERQFVCRICGTALKTEAILKRHVKNVHDEKKLRPHRPEGIFKCPTCSKGFGTKSNLRSHINGVHLNIRNHKCPALGCGLAFGTKDKLKSHIEAIHEQKKYSCPEQDCPKFYKSKRSLALHIANKHPGMYTCKETDKENSDNESRPATEETIHHSPGIANPILKVKKEKKKKIVLKKKYVDDSDEELLTY